jgi:hypothetical protein
VQHNRKGLQPRSSCAFAPLAPVRLKVGGRSALNLKNLRAQRAVLGMTKSKINAGLAPRGRSTKSKSQLASTSILRTRSLVVAESARLPTAQLQVERLLSVKNQTRFSAWSINVSSRLALATSTQSVQTR